MPIQASKTNKKNKVKLVDILYGLVPWSEVTGHQGTKQHEPVTVGLQLHFDKKELIHSLLGKYKMQVTGHRSQVQVRAQGHPAAVNNTKRTRNTKLCF